MKTKSIYLREHVKVPKKKRSMAKGSRKRSLEALKGKLFVKGRLSRIRNPLFLLKLSEKRCCDENFNIDEIMVFICATDPIEDL